MPISAVLETLDGVDGAVKSLYVEVDGKFHLDLDDSIKDHTAIGPLKRARDHEKAAAAKARDDLAAATEKLKAVPDDFDAEKWAKLKDGKPDEAALVQVRQELEGQITDLQGQLDTERAASLKTAVERDLGDVLTEVGVTNASFAKAARSMISPLVKVQEGKPVVETDMGPMPLADYAKKWAAGEGKDFVTPPKGGGAKPGEKGGKGSNPLLEKVPALADLPEK